MKYLLAHWQGRQTFKQAFIVNGLLPIAILLLFQHSILEPLVQHFGWLRMPLLATMAAIYLAIIFTGVVSINRKLRISGAQTYGNGYAVMVCNSGYFLAFCLVLVNLFDIPTSGVTTKAPIEQAFLPTDIYIDENDNTRAYLSGEINPFTPDRLESFLKTNSDISTLALESSGGHVIAARIISAMISRYNIDTHVDQHCYSSCTLIFISGNTRTMSSNARLGFHGYRYETAKSLYEDVKTQQKKDAAIFLAQGVSEHFINRIFDTSPDDLWLPSIPKLVSAGVIQQPGN